MGNTWGCQDTQQAKSLRQGNPVITNFSCRSVAMDAVTVPPMAVLLGLLLVAPSTAHDSHHHHVPSPNHHHNTDAPNFFQLLSYSDQ
jgi:hypothetical protein